MSRTEEHIDNLILAYLNSELDGAEKAELESWVSSSPDNREYFSKTCQVWLATGIDACKEKFDVSDAFAEFKQSCRIEMKPVVRPWRYVTWFAAAASILIAVFVSYNAGRNNISRELTEITAEVPFGSSLKMTLPDGSLVCLNAGSTIKYSQGFGVVDRRISLSGECYFDVAHNEEMPFVVTTHDLDVRVVGTKFNFRDYPEDLEAIVSLLEGRVALNNNLRNDEGERYLNPGQRVVLDKHVGDMRIESKDVENSVQWMSGNLFFDEELLPDITNELERHYGTKIYIHGDRLRNLRIYGNIVPREMSLSEVMESLAATNRIDYSFEDGTVILSEPR